MSPGAQTVTLQAHDRCAERTASLSLAGAEIAGWRDVTALLTTTWPGTWDPTTRQERVEVRGRNTSDQLLDGALLFAPRPSPGVSLQADGLTPEGQPFVTLTQAGPPPGASTPAVPLVFSSPEVLPVRAEPRWWTRLSRDPLCSRCRR